MMYRTKLKTKLLSFGVFEDNEYLDKYVSLILANESTVRERFKTQKHHIIPKHVYKYLKIAEDNSSSNIVNLTYNNHVMAHFYLFQCSSNNYIKRGNFAALEYIVHNRYVPKSEVDILIELPEYQSMYEEYIKLLSESLKVTQVGEKNPFYGKHHTTETRALIRDRIINLSPEVKEYNKQRIREANCGRVKTAEEKQKRLDTMEQHGGYGFWITDEYREKLSESLKGKNTHTKGRIHINNGIQAKMVTSSELDTYLSNGWKLGRLPVSDEVKQKHREFKKGKPFTSGLIWVTNESDTRLINPNELNKYIESGYRRGRTLVKEIH